MSELERFRKALERIAYYEVSAPVDEWSEAEAFEKVQQLASEALDPASKIIRIQREQHAQATLQRKVSALRRGERYYYDGSWVKFLGGHRDETGIVYVRSGNSDPFCIHVTSLQLAPGVLLP